MYQTFYLPTKIISGAGSLSELPSEVKKLGSKVVVVSDPGVKKVGILGLVETALHEAGVEAAVYSDVQSNPTVENAEEVAALAARFGADVFVAVGGGSSIDTAKSASVLLNNPGSLLSYAGFDLFENQPAPVIAIPTTAGTGSEVTIVAVMADTKAHRKFTVGSVRMSPRVALLDAKLTLGLPPFITAYTGMDALTHAIESYTSTAAQRVTDAINLDTISNIFANLPTAVLRGDDLQGREAMLYASCMASMTCNSTFLGLVHAIASPVCALSGVAHGLACAVLLPAVMEYNLPVAEKKYAQLALTIGVAGHCESQHDQALKAIAAVKRLALNIGIPEHLRDIGVKEEDLAEIATVSVNYPQAKTNCRLATFEEIKQLLQRAY